MTKPDLFEAALLEAQRKRKDKLKVEINCDTVHPIVAEYMIETMERISKAEVAADPDVAGINVVVGDLVRQAAACLTEEIFGQFDTELAAAEGLALEVLEDLPSDEQDDDTDMPDGWDDDDPILMMSLGALEVIIKTALKIGYLVIPEVEKHFD